MTPDEKIEIVNAVLSSLRTNSKTIDQLPLTKVLNAEDAFEVSTGNKITKADLEVAILGGRDKQIQDNRGDINYLKQQMSRYEIIKEVK